MMDKKDNSRTVVFIDDDDIAHYLIKTLLKLHRPDLSLTSYLSAFEALSLMERNEFEAAVILLDINMPKMNGWEFLQEIKKFGCNVPVYILTSSEDAKDMVRVKEFKNVLGYFTKPLTPEQLKTVCDKHLSS
jgi:CheY-like chemotaxis protein